MRRWADLVLVGARTILADRPRLDARLAHEDDGCVMTDPTPGYVDTDLSVDASWPNRPHLVFGGRESAPPDRVAAVREAGGTAVLCDEREGRVVPASLLEHLAGLGVYAVLLEGGPTLAASFLAAGLVDRWVSFVAPIFLGGGATWPQLPDEAGGTHLFHLTRCERWSDDVRVVHDRVPLDETLRSLTTLGEA